MSRIGSTRSSASPTAWPCCATARWSGSGRSTDTTPEELVSLIVGRKAREISRPRQRRTGRQILTRPRPGLRRRRPGQLRRCARARCSASSACAAPGRRTIGRALFGASSPCAVTITLDGSAPDLVDAADRAMRLGHRPRRARPGRGKRSPPRLSIRENTFLNPSAHGQRGLLSRSWRRHGGRAWRARSAHASACRPTIRALPIEALSGGNQQKVVVGRWLRHRPQAADRRGPDGRRRCRRQGRDLPPARRGARRGPGRRSSSRPISRKSPRSATARWCSAAGRIVAELTGRELSTESLIQAASAG